MSSQIQPQVQVTGGQGRTVIHLSKKKETPTPYNNARPQSNTVDYDLINIDQKLYSMRSTISESRTILHASRSTIAALTENYEQKLLMWYHAHEDLKTEHKMIIANLEEDRRSLRQQLDIARRTIQYNESALAGYQKTRQNNQAQNMNPRNLQMETAIKKTEDHAKMAEKKVPELEEEKTGWMRKPREELAAADTLGNMAALEKGRANQAQDYEDVLSATRKERLQERDDKFQTPDSREFIRSFPVNPSKIISAPFSGSGKRERSETSQDVQQRNRKIRREEGTSKEIDEGTIVVKMRGESGQPFIG